MPLLTPKKEEEDLLEKQQEDSLLARMKMFVQLRQDLERVKMTFPIYHYMCYLLSNTLKYYSLFLYVHLIFHVLHVGNF